MNCTCNARHEGHCDAANGAVRHYYQQQQLAGAGDQGYVSQGYTNQDLAGKQELAAGIVATKAKEAEPSIRAELVKTARELLQRGRSMGNMSELGQAIALLDCAARVGAL